MKMNTYMQTSHWQVYIVEQIMVVLDRHARAEENDDLLLSVLLQKREQQHESLL